MNIAILIPSRSRPRLLSAVISALHELESGENEVEYRVGFDTDDLETGVTVSKLGIRGADAMEFAYLNGAQGTIGSIWNGLSRWRDADIYSCMIDDAFPISPHWDKEMVRLSKQFEAFTWFEVSAPANVGYPTCTKAWLDRVGFIGEEHYPYWFYDTSFQEIVNFTTNQPVPASQQLALYSRQEVTQNLRDLSFWWGFFSATRGLRLKKAYELVYNEFKWSFEEFKTSRKRWIEASNARDRQFRGQGIEQLEKERASKAPPSRKYMLAKQKAEEYLKDNGLVIWGGLDD